MPEAGGSHRAPIYALLAGTAISQVGNHLSALAIPWFVLQTTGSATRTGLVVAMIPLLANTVGLGFASLLLLVFLGALFDSPGNTARMALLPEVAQTAGMRLERANAVSQTIQALSGLLGPPLAGLLIVAMGTSNVLWLDAASFGVSVLLGALAVPASTAQRAPRSRYLDDVREGLRYLWSDRLLRSVALIATVVNFLVAPLFSVVLPVYANRVFGSAGDLGVMMAGFGTGALIGSSAYGTIGHRASRRWTLIGGLVVLGLPMWILATLPGLLMAAAALGVAGLAAGSINPLVMTVLQERVPAELRGRALGTLMAMAVVATPLGMLLAGSLVAALGVAGVLFAIAACYLATTVSLFFNPALHALHAPTSTRTGVPTGHQPGSESYP